MAKKKKPDPKPSKKARKPVVEDEDDLDEIEEYGDEPDDSGKPKNDIYVGLGAITLLAFLVGATFLYLDQDETAKKPAPTANVTVGDLKLGGGRAPQ